jgi:hypothetical protein
MPVPKRCSPVKIISSYEKSLVCKTLVESSPATVVKIGFFV